MKDYPEKRHEHPDRRPPRDMHPYRGPFHDPFFDAMDDFFKPMFFDEPDRMRTDITETDGGYQIDVELPGYDKKDINVTLEDGYLTVCAQKSGKDNETPEKGGRYVIKECSVSCRRSYFVGEDIQRESIKAKYTNGVLSLTVPKAKPKELPSTYIEIE
ncbi:MAG: Hsp20/alpha crystallin family protein [Clostridia bacterium]|nr:Hsp20/alpha crystallin family protein [Clostridia bacterium]